MITTKKLNTETCYLKFISFEFLSKFVQGDNRRFKKQAVEPGDEDDDLESILSGISVNGMHAENSFNTLHKVLTYLPEETVNVFLMANHHLW